MVARGSWVRFPRVTWPDIGLANRSFREGAGWPRSLSITADRRVRSGFYRGFGRSFIRAMGDSMFEVDADGWIAQHSGRPLTELVREIMQNALDSGTDIRVRIDSTKHRVEVIDDGPGFSNIEDAWSVFGGDKASDPEKRGRFGRGVKEAAASCELMVIETVGGRVEFDVEERSRTVFEDRGRDSGTRVIMENSEWHPRHDIKELREYVESFWPPENQTITLDIAGGKEYDVERPEPEIIENTRLPTVVVNDDGEMDTDYRRTELHIRDSGRKSGTLYEMGIPVDTDAPFNFHVDVQQKVPLAEQRNEPDSWWYERQLQVKLAEAVVDEMTQKEMRESWFITAVDNSRSDDLKGVFVENVVEDKRKNGVVYSSNAKADDKAENHGYQVFHPEQSGSEIGKIVRDVADSSASVAQELAKREEEQVEPNEAQRRVIEEMEELCEIAGYEAVDVELWDIEDVTAGRSIAQHKNGTIRLNRNARDWEELNEENVGTLIHELAHVKHRNHSDEWRKEMQRIGGRLVTELM